MTNWNIKACNHLSVSPKHSPENERRSLKSGDCFGDGVVFILQTAKYLQASRARKEREWKLNGFIMVLGILALFSVAQSGPQKFGM